jgi:hypothetical protein
MRVKSLGGLYLFLVISLSLSAQEKYPKAEESPHQKDTCAHSLKEFCGKGHVYGHFRNHFMATYNQGELSDYWTNASGGALGYESAVWKNFQFGIKGIFTYQTFSSDLNEEDKLTGKSARWEKQLYDVTRPEETKDLDRLEELYLRYYFGRKGFIEYGKLDINDGPLHLRRDSRMKPFVYKGLWTNYRFNNHHQVKGGWIHGVSPRGMTEWFSINEAIGILNNGYQPDGTPAHYHETANSRGLAVLHYNYSPNKDLKLQLWNYTYDRLMNISWFQTDYERKKFFCGLEYVHQRAMPYQAQLEYAARYYQPDEQAHVINLKAGYKQGILKLSGIYFHALNTGRFLHPRELGLDGFWGSQSRSFMDGLGNTDVWVLRMELQPNRGVWRHLHGDFRLSYTDAPGADQPQFNKYIAYDQYQITSKITYHFKQVFEGLELTCLYIRKIATDVDALTPSQLFYRSHFHHLNFVVNIDF